MPVHEFCLLLAVWESGVPSGARHGIYRAKIVPNLRTGCSSKPNSVILKRPDQEKR